MGRRQIDVKDVSVNPFTAVGRDWMLLAAGNESDGSNAMTVSWGHLGAIWGSSDPTVVVYVRPQRYTKVFLDRETKFTLSAFPADRKAALTYMGTHSGRDGDKAAAAGLTPVYFDGTVGFAEASLTFVCEKIYTGQIREEGFLDKSILSKNYPLKDYHTMYVGRVTAVYEKTEP